MYSAQRFFKNAPLHRFFFIQYIGKGAGKTEAGKVQKEHRHKCLCEVSVLLF